MKQRIAAFRIGIRGREIFYYNSTTGTRFLTFQELVRLGSLSDDQLRRQLQEIRELAASWNPHCNPEIAFFMADDSFHVSAMVRFDFQTLPAEELRAAYEDLCRRFRGAVPAEFRQDDPENSAWRNRMFSVLIAESDEAVSEETLLGLSPEFFMQIHWLPGGRIDDGEMMFDEVFEEHPGDPQRAAACDDKCPGVPLQPGPRVRRPGIRQPGPRGQFARPPSRALRPPRRVHRGDQAAGLSPRDGEHHPHAEVGRPRAPQPRRAAGAGHAAVRGVHRVRARPPDGLPSPGHEHPLQGDHAENLRALLRPPQPVPTG